MGNFGSASGELVLLPDTWTLRTRLLTTGQLTTDRTGKEMADWIWEVEDG
jgi:hypothetical protein